MGRGAAGCCGLCDCCDAKPVQVGEKGVFKRSEDRHCTDILFFLLYWAGWAIIAAIFISASAAGADINRVTRGTDFDGNICGKTDATAGRPYAAWPYPEAYAVQVCVSHCNFTQTDTDYMLFNYPSTKFMYWCIPGNYNATKYVAGLFDTSSYDSSGAMATRAMGDMYTAWPVILISAGVALALSYFYIWISKYAGKCFVWLVILLILGAGVLLGVALWVKAADVDELETNGSAKAMKVLAGIVWGITGVFFLVIIFLRDRINIAIEVVRQAGEAIEDMKLIICFPIIPFMFGCLYIFFWCVLTFYLFTVGDLNPYVPMPNSIKTYHDRLPTGVTLQGFETIARVNYTRFDWNESYKGALAMNLFHLLWNVQFIVYFCYLASAGAIANWYFSRPPKGAKETDERERGDGVDQLPRNAVSAAAYRTCRFHWGTVAFGAFIIAVIQFIRMVVTYVEKKTQARTNNFMKCVYCLLQCCLKCLQCCMDKVSKNAFVWTAIWGDNFVTAACSSFSLLWNNMARVAAINLVSSFLMMLGRVLVALATTGVCGFIIRNIYGDEISSLVMPLVVILVLSFMVASLFMIVVETTIDTIFLCVLIDESLKRDGHIHYWSSSMEKLINGKEVSERSQRIAKERNEQNELRKQGGHNRNAPGAAPTAAPTPLSPTAPVSAGPGASAGGLQVGVSLSTPAGGPTFAAVATASPAAGGGAYPTLT